MNKNTKKKVLSLALIIALLAIAVVGGSLAWFTAEDSAENTFTIGSVEIVQHEKQYSGEKDQHGRPILEDFKDDKVLLPIVNVDAPNTDKNYQDKMVYVQNVGKNDAYVQTHIAVDERLKDYIRLFLTPGYEHSWTAVNETLDPSGRYYVYTYRYVSAIKPTQGTTQILQGVYMDHRVNIQDNPGTEAVDPQFCILNEKNEYEFSGVLVDDNTKIHVLVASQAVQADGFANAKEALDAAFGSNLPDFSQEQ